MVPSDDVDRFDRWGRTYDRSFLQRIFFGPVQAAMLDLAGEYFAKNPPGSILDIGCGTGRLLQSAGRKWPAARLAGIDPAQSMLAAAKATNPVADLRSSFAETLPFDDQSFDLVTTSLSFHHWKDQAKALHEICRVVKSGGRLCIADPTFPLAKLVNDRVRSRKVLWKMMAEAGFTVVRSIRKRFVLITLAALA
jgi:ubiquinone/menaquinone biosynthesis C-methylase UbiE